MKRNTQGSSTQDLRYLHLQGYQAAAFFLNAAESAQLEESLKTVVRDITIISSKFRTDVFYYHQDNLSEAIFRKWRDVKSISQSSYRLNKFISHVGKEMIYRQYFFSLIQLTNNELGFDAYCARFNELIVRQKRPELFKGLIECNKSVVKRLDNSNRTKALLAKLGNICSDLRKDAFKTISEQAILELNPN